MVRKIKVKNVSCLRIIDLYGSLHNAGDLSSSIQDILMSENSEYIDCYNHGISDSVFSKIGFNKKSESEIIPNYFEPFEKANHDFSWAYTTIHKNFCIFKGDGDQDRPNHSEEKP